MGDSSGSLLLAKVVEPGFCSGCGLCAGICPSSSLMMEYNGKKELVPHIKGHCSGCALCLNVCPFSGEGKSIDEVSEGLYGHLPGVGRLAEAGWFISAQEGHACRGDFRSKGASGGMASWFLTKVLEDGIADAVLSAGPDKARPGSWTFVRTEKPEDVVSLAGSVYHPVPFDEAFRAIMSEPPGIRLAVVALPCLAYGLRKAMRKIPLLGERIVLLASLTCGLMPTHRYSEYVSLESGVLPEEMGYINFRLPPDEPDSGNYRHVAISRDGVPGKPVSVKGIPNFLWGHGCFIQGGCLVCDDVFGETADVVFMDAWLPEYARDTKGNSIVLCRSPLANSIVRGSVSSGECRLRETAGERLLRSQVQTLWIKRLLLQGRLAKLEAEGLEYPRRRVVPDMKVYRENEKYFLLCERLKKAVEELPLETFEDLESFRNIVGHLMVDGADQ